MRVLHVAPAFGRSEGGPSEMLRGLIPAQRTLDDEVTLLATTKNATPADDDVATSGWATVVPYSGLGNWTFSRSFVRRMWPLVRLADVVHVHSLWTFTSTVTMLACVMTRTPFVVQPHGSLDRYHLAQGRPKKVAYLRGIDGFALRRASMVVCCTAKEANEARQVISPPVTTVGLGVDDSLFELSRVMLAERGRTVLFLSRLAAKKRLDLALQALSRLPRNVDLIVAGAPSSDLEFSPAELVSDLGLAGRVTFAGQVDSTHRRNLMARCPVLLLPSDDESFGMAAAEAMAAGMIVVASPHVGVAVDAAEVCAAVVVPQDPDAIAAAVSEVLDDPVGHQGIAEAGTQMSHARFRWPGIATELRQVYANAASNAEEQ